MEKRKTVVPDYWTIECSQHLKMIFRHKVKTTHLSEKKLVEFMKVLLAKYALSPEEILETFTRIPFKPSKDYIQISRSDESIHKNITISFSGQVADISITAWLSD